SGDERDVAPGSMGAGRERRGTFPTQCRPCERSERHKVGRGPDGELSVSPAGGIAVTTPATDARLTRDHLERLFTQMKARRIVVVGDAMLGSDLAGEAERISPEAPVPVVSVHTRRHALGGAANVAANVAAIGAECLLVAAIGDDARGDSFRAELAQHRLADRHIVVVAARPTTSKTRVTARGQQLVRIDEEVEDLIPARTETQLLGQLDAVMADADALVIEDHNKGTVTPAVMARPTTAAWKRGIRGDYVLKSQTLGAARVRRRPAVVEGRHLRCRRRGRKVGRGHGLARGSPGDARGALRPAGKAEAERTALATRQADADHNPVDRFEPRPTAQHRVIDA